MRDKLRVGMVCDAEMIEADWSSPEAKEIAFDIAAAGVVMMAFADITTFFFVFLFPFMVDTKPFLFPGAYLHYRRRIRS